ncbi:MAG: glutaminase A [Clostridiales bacterium]|nr:glutaminase A [Clostridiales bacterium]
MDKKYLDSIIKEYKHYTIEGQVADYIPELKKMERCDLGIAIIDRDNIFTAGEWEKKFTIQSVSKPIVLILALMDRGEDKIFELVGKEPTGDPFNSMVRLETYTMNKPLNPMINAGAISISSLIKGKDNEERLARILNFFRLLSDNESLEVNQDVFKSEKETGNRNRSLAYFLKDIHCIEGDVEEALDLYFMQCSIEVNTLDLAKIGLILANDGLNINTGEQLIPKKYAKIAKTFMLTCGMYDESGKFAIDVGIPSKSGVGGGIMSSVPQRYGIGVFGPSLNKKGNSVAGMRMLEKISKDYEMSIF